jgi:fucose permease
LAPAILRRVSEGRLVLIGLCVACCGAVLILFTASVPVLLIALAVSGAGLASVFPNTIAMLAPNFGSAATRVGSLMFALAGLGGATLPWAVGWASTQFGTLRMGFGVTLLSNLLMIILQASILMTVARRSD